MEISRKIYNLQSLNIFKGCKSKIAILGGSFNPAHSGHLQMSKIALSRFGFDFVIWLVALQNPFKEKYSKDIFERAREAAEIVDHPRIIVSTAEYDIGSTCTFESLKELTTRFNTIDFTWLMGADNLEHFHKWKRYRDIMKMCKILVFDRPRCSKSIASFRSKLGTIIDKNQVKAIMFYRGFMSKISSSEIRRLENDKNC